MKETLFSLLLLGVVSSTPLMAGPTTRPYNPPDGHRRVEEFHNTWTSGSGGGQHGSNGSPSSGSPDGSSGRSWFDWPSNGPTSHSEGSRHGDRTVHSMPEPGGLFELAACLTGLGTFALRRRLVQRNSH